MAETPVEEVLNDAFANARAKLKREAIDVQRERRKTLDELSAAGESLATVMNRAYDTINTPTSDPQHPKRSKSKRKAKRGWRFWKR